MDPIVAIAVVVAFAAAHLGVSTAREKLRQRQIETRVEHQQKRLDLILSGQNPDVVGPIHCVPKR